MRRPETDSRATATATVGPVGPHANIAFERAARVVDVSLYIIKKKVDLHILSVSFDFLINLSSVTTSQNIPTKLNPYLY